MNQIGFKNFRRFKNLTPQDLGEITILVGANNAGKSTLVKGLLLILDNIRSMRVSGGEGLESQLPEFRFDANEYHDLGIGTFGRARYNKATKDMISFAVRLSQTLEPKEEMGSKSKKKADYSIVIDVTGDSSHDQTTGSISRIWVSDNIRGIKFDFNYDAGTTKVEFSTTKSGSNDMRKQLMAKIEMLEKELRMYYEESKALKDQIAHRHEVLRRETEDRMARMSAEFEMLSKENADALSRMSSIDPTSPDAIKTMKELNDRMELLQDKQMARREEMMRESEMHFKEEIARLNTMSNSTLMKIADRNAELDKLRKSLEMLTKEDSVESKSMTVSFDEVFYSDMIGGNFIVNQMKELISFCATSKPLADEAKEDASLIEKWQNEESDKAYVHERSGILRELSEDLEQVIAGISAEYIYAHSASQNIFYNTADKNDYMAKAIHRFYREKIQPGTIAHTFIINWMKEFGIGDSFEIEPFGGEAYRFYIYEGKDRMDLADKGMGSNQMMILLISLATFIRKYEHSQSKPFIVIEEPEQNLHPDLQRKLTELLAYVSDTYHFKFIVETHSEYMIRRSQVLVAESHYKDKKDIQENCPFKVYYFPKDEAPYDMEYTPTGRFAKPFGKFFYDASAQDSIMLNKLEMASRNK